ncbi:hypothetical protein GE21DRAFT_1353963 [Neurospora crassa]|nr:hypothetical protein B24M22.150 [imported] - Neurospora crassa [Neurospora crassa]KHE82914.1 hypothetical protein GE21DRAFT_1353963 [Neurospora crassa]
MERKEQKRRNDVDDGLVRLEIKVRNTLHLFVLCKAPPQPICVATKAVQTYGWMSGTVGRECCRQSDIGSQRNWRGGNNEYKEPTGAAGWSWMAGVLQCLPTVQDAKAGSWSTPRSRHIQAWSNGNIVIDGICVYVSDRKHPSRRNPKWDAITLHLTDPTLPSTSPPNRNIVKNHVNLEKGKLFSPGHSSLCSKHLGGLRYGRAPLQPLCRSHGDSDSGGLLIVFQELTLLRLRKWADFKVKVKPPKPLFTFRGNMGVYHPQSPSTITVTPRPWCSLISRFWKPIAALSVSDSHGFANHCHIGWARWLIRTPIFRFIRSTVGGKS